MKKNYIIILIILSIGYLFSADPVVSNSSATPEAGQVVIKYDLVADGDCQIVILVSADDGSTYDIYPTALSGDIGRQVESGSGKEIIWRPSADGMEIGEDYKVKIIARDNVVDTEDEFETFIKIEGGTFNNGTADVTLSDFYMSKYEVTQAEYEAVVGINPSSYGIGNNFPVHDISWYDAVEYCNIRSLQEGLTPCYDTTDWSYDFSKNGYRLPTEMEWIYAAKGGIDEPSTGYNLWSGTNVVGSLQNYAWYRFNANDASHSVGGKLPNELGLYDMSGNVWEWCNDRYNATLSNVAQTNPTGPTTGTDRIVHGSCWTGTDELCKTLTRGWGAPTSDSYVYGFRLVRSVE